MSGFWQWRRHLALPFCNLRTMTIPLKPAAKQNELSKLVELIAEATKVVEAYYEASYIPSLDKTEAHPLDNDVSPPSLRKAIQTIEAACAQLCATITKPKLAIVNRESEIYAPPCLNVAIRLKIADILNDKPQGAHISDIAEAACVDANKLGRVLRLLATKHVFREVTPNVFANNRLSIQLLSNTPLWNLGMIMTDELGRATGELINLLEHPEWGTSTTDCETAMNLATGFEGNLFDYLMSGSPPKLECLAPSMSPPSSEAHLGPAAFGSGMQGYSSAIEAESIVREYPWDRLSDGSLVCDVGGGVGHMAMALALAHPHLRLKVQDLEPQIANAKLKEWPSDCITARGRIEYEPMDFFKDSPIPGCDVYYLKHVIHNWNDQDCLTILTNIRKAMKSSSRLLIHEFVAQYACEDPKLGHSQAPAPLLPNYGMGRLQQYTLDIAMMSLLNATERPREDFIRLGHAAGLEFVKVWDFDQLSAVEFKLPSV